MSHESLQLSTTTLVTLLLLQGGPTITTTTHSAFSASPQQLDPSTQFCSTWHHLHIRATVHPNTFNFAKPRPNV